MLMLSRRSGSTIQIGEDITIVIADITASQVRIGIKAPRRVRIMRGERLDWPDVEVPGQDDGEEGS